MTTIDLTAYNALVNDDGSNTTGTLATKANVLLTPILTPVQTAVTALDAAILAGDTPVVQTTTSTGTVNDFALTSKCALLRCNNATLLTLTGLATGTDGQRLDIVAIGAGNVDITNQGGGSTAANRVITGESATVTVAPTTGRARLIYDSTTARWRVLAPAQTVSRVKGHWGAGAQSITNNTFTALTLDSTAFNVDTIFSGGNPTRFTAPYTGVYLLGCTAMFAANATGQRELKGRLNATSDLTGGAAIIGNVSGTIATTLTVQYLASLTATDYIEFYALQTSGGNLNVGAATGYQSTMAYMFRIA